MSVTQPVADDDADADAALATDLGLAIVRAAGPIVADMLNTQSPHIAYLAMLHAAESMLTYVVGMTSLPNARTDLTEQTIDMLAAGLREGATLDIDALRHALRLASPAQGAR